MDSPATVDPTIDPLESEPQSNVKFLEKSGIWIEKNLKYDRNVNIEMMVW